MSVQVPSLEGKVDYNVAILLRELAAQGNHLEDTIATWPQPATPLTLDQIRRELSATGSAPLNIYQLIGGNTAGSVRQGTHSTRLSTSVGSLPVGTLFWEPDRTALYLTTTGGSWQLVGNIELGVTLAGPDTKPTDLGLPDAGFIIRSSDFDRLYRWSGAAWADLRGQSQRGHVAFFPEAYAPTTGWQLCDGTAGVAISTPTGGTTTVTVPYLTGSNRFIRSVSGTTGGTGGAATTHTHPVDPPSTTSGNDSGAGTVVAAGAGTTVATHTHTHDTDIASFTSGTPSGTGGDDALPPYLNLRPYMRL